jgi:hypothetical protein
MRVSHRPREVDLDQGWLFGVGCLGLAACQRFECSQLTLRLLWVLRLSWVTSLGVGHVETWMPGGGPLCSGRERGDTANRVVCVLLKSRFL